MDDLFFPTIKKSLDTFLNDEEGNIPRHRLLAIGTMVILMGYVLTLEAFAAHSSHRSHSSHSSHRSHSSHSSHRSHSSHSSGTHGSHSSHSNHSNMPSVPSLNAPNSADFPAELPSSIASVPVVPAASPSLDIISEVPEAATTQDTPKIPK